MTAGSTTERWTTRSLMRWMTDAFAERRVDEPRLTAELLIEHAAGLSRMDLYTQADRPASADELERLRAIVKRVLAGEPVQYALGHWYFFGLRFMVDRRVLIPRPCTELIVEEVMQDLRRRTRDASESADVATVPDAAYAARAKGIPDGGIDGTAPTPTPTAPAELTYVDASAAGAGPDGGVDANTARGHAPVDQSPSTQNAHTDDRRENDNAPAGSGLLIGEIGVGSGAIAVSLAKHLHGVRIIATDISHDALEVARTNAETHGVAARITFLCGDGATPLLEAADVRAHGGLDYLVSNPPYIPDAEWDDPAMMDAHVREHEPAIALRGGADGLDVIRPIVRAAPRLLKPEGVLVVETAASTAQTLADGVNRTPGVRTRTIRTDMDGKPRVVVAERDA